MAILQTIGLVGIFIYMIMVINAAIQLGAPYFMSWGVLLLQLLIAFFGLLISVIYFYKHHAAAKFHLHAREGLLKGISIEVVTFATNVLISIIWFVVL